MSPAEKVALLPEVERTKFLDEIVHENGLASIADLDHLWGFWARPKQLPPPTDCQCGCQGRWLYWMLLAGRGFGKTRTGSEWVHEQVNSGVYGRFHLVGATASDIRDIMVEGPAGLQATQKPYNKTTYYPTKRSIKWANGAVALLFSADEPERLRGEQCEAAWADELAAWRYTDAWQQLQLGLRLGPFPRTIITTTPRPTPLIRKIAKDDRTHVTAGSTYENVGNLSEVFINEITSEFEGTRIGRQEIYAEILDDSELALWNRDLIEDNRVKKDEVPENQFTKVVIGIDPAVSYGRESAETGICVAAISKKGVAYVLEDETGKYRPEHWASKAVSLYHFYSRSDNPWGAPEVRVVAEKNQGYELVRHTINVYDPEVPVKLVDARKNKITRAEPIATAMERGRVKHVGIFPKLEEQMCTWEQGDPESPDRLDAMVWALSELVGRRGYLMISNMVTNELAGDSSYWKMKSAEPSY
jgi:phage terminase large subunit-like protein